MKTEQISLILPTYNAVDELKLAIRSLKNNTRSSYELVILVDPLQQTQRPHPGILKFLDEARIFYHINEKNIGPYAAWNKGAQMASHEILVFITDDQYFAPNWDIGMLHYLKPKKLLTCQLVEPGVITVWQENTKYDCGHAAATFDEEKFLSFIQKRDEKGLAESGFFIPMMLFKKDFFAIGAFPTAGVFGTDQVVANDVAFVKQAKKMGYQHFRVLESYSYHFQGSSWKKRDSLTLRIDQVKDRINRSRLWLQKGLRAVKRLLPKP